MSREQRIKSLLETHFHPEFLEITNQSDKHKHHAGDDGTGETHYDITLHSALFNGKTKVACHRLVNDILLDEFKTGLHALSLMLKGTDKC